MEEEKEKVKLSQDSSLNEIYDHMGIPENGINVRPVTLQEDAKDTRMIVMIRGEHATASFLMAEIMSKIQELFDLQQQQEASSLIARV